MTGTKLQALARELAEELPVDLASRLAANAVKFGEFDEDLPTPSPEELSSVAGLMGARLAREASGVGSRAPAPVTLFAVLLVLALQGVPRCVLWDGRTRAVPPSRFWPLQPSECP